MKKLFILACVILPFAAVQSCKKQKKETEHKTISLDLPETTYAYYSGNKLVVPLQNEKATLGRVLFYDPRLSLNNAVSCASCHKQEFAFADDVAFSRGFENRLTGRNSMPIENLVFNNGKFSVSAIGDRLSTGATTMLFWDGREKNLQNLIARPLTNHIEMGIEDVNALPQKLAGLDYYEELFADAYGTGNITFDRISESIAFFITSIKAANTRYDQFLANKTQFTALEAQGMALFTNKYDCSNCHRIDTTGYTLSSAFMDIGLAKRNGDNGQGAYTNQQSDMNVFKIPNLRNVGLTAPYMHDGRFKTLHEVLDHYSSGIENTANLNELLKDDQGQPMRMNISASEKDAIVAFLNTLTDYSMVTDKCYSNPFVIK